MTPWRVLPIPRHDPIRTRRQQILSDLDPLLRLAIHIQRLALRERRKITDKLRQLLAAVSGRLPLKGACDAVPDLIVQCDYFVRPRIETRKDRRGVGKARDCSAIGQFARRYPTINMARLTSHAVAAESFMSKELLPALDGFFQVWLSGGSLRNAQRAKT